MLPAADELYLKLVYQRLADLAQTAGTPDQRSQAVAARNRTTAALVARGWHVAEIAAALGMTKDQLSHWHRSGRQLDHRGLALPRPANSLRSDSSGGRLTVAETAIRLKVDPVTVRRWIKAGRLAATRSHAAGNAPWLIDASTLRDLGASGEILTVEEMAARHDVDPLTVRTWIRRQLLPAICVLPGGAVRIPAAAERPRFGARQSLSSS